MPYAIELPFSLRTLSRPLPYNAMTALHANFFQWLRAADPSQADRLHPPPRASPSDDEPDQPLAAAPQTPLGPATKQPFTVSPIIVPYGQRQRPDHDGAGSLAAVRITLLDDALIEILETGLRKRPYLKLYDDTLELHPGRHIWAESYQRLSRQTDHSDALTLSFDTPTCFRSGRLSHILPEPTRVFGHYLKQWNTFAPPHLHMDEAILTWVTQHIGISNLRLHSDVFRFADSDPTTPSGSARVQIGFIGQVTYHVINHKAAAETSHASLIMWNCLANFAPFCGTGARTPQGMGQTRLR